MKKYFLVLIVIIISVRVNGQNSKKKINSIENYQVLNLVVKNVSVVTMKNDSEIKNQDVVIKNGLIESISNTKKKKYKNFMTIDGSNKFIMPSLADAHVHLPKDENDLKKTLILNLINGVTKLRSMRGNWNHLEWREKYNMGNSAYPKLYLSSPPISRNYTFTSQELNDYIQEAKNFDFIKILSIKDESLFKELDSLCKINNINIAGHFPSNITDIEIFKSNYTSFEHLGGLTEESMLTSVRLQAVKDNNISICPTLSWYSVGSGRYTLDELRNLRGMEYISDVVVEEWIEKTKEYRERLGVKAYQDEVELELLKLDKKYKVIAMLNKLGVQILLSPDSSSKYMVPGFGMVGEMELLKNTGLDNFDILQMATVNFAAFFEEDYGFIEEGKKADFVLLKNNPLKDIKALETIEGVYFNNNFLNKETLGNLSQSILPN
ncbi:MULTISPECIES: amidohydrolase family protein [unclassified Cellulophaga]|uniref:amidohydrolase family protein n=1 Tax=unclassified Cellulophaga TaxID=2634405 RepID=UPI0026E12B73|nr:MULTISPECIES: amidohydrolase family protein [unclassified Cellulophaga]MDO6491220.1 amidohydrolase family protein [Cellulophaga sp. 2_MG-2023]MDO6495247.1 amidohydrolase family protein [Cellulophaga sp. 3_MG-2023]